MTSAITIGLAQIAPVWLLREPTIDKVVSWIQKGADQGCDVIAFGETLIPGYPYWTEHTDGARFNHPLQKEMFAHYVEQAVCIPEGHLDRICQIAKKTKTMVLAGCYERAMDRGGHSGYCSLVTISNEGEILNAHRKVMPTYEERLVWGIGDGHGLRTFRHGEFTIGGLNCWENWMPLMRAALQGQGEDLHFAVWPGNVRNTKDITRFMAMEGRSFVASVAGLLKKSDFPDEIPHVEVLRDSCPEVLANGGSCVAGPDGEWIIEPVDSKEQLLTVTLEYDFVRRERHNFDPAGHYSRPDVTELRINRARQSTVRIEE